MRWIVEFISGLWGLASRSWVSLSGNLRPHSGASALYLFLFLFFCVIGLALVLLGFDLDDVDRWLDAQSGWIEMLATLALKGLLASILLICALMIGVGLYVRFFPTHPSEHRERRRRAGVDEDEEEQPLGWGAMIGALILGYFCWAGLFF